MTNNNFNDYINDLIKTSDLIEVAPNMTINDKNINVQPEKEVEATIQEALNASQEDQVISASLNGFKLAERNDGYLLVSHVAMNEANLGVVGAQEYNTSKDKAELLKTVLKDSIARTASYNYKLEFTGSFVEPVIEKVAYPDPVVPVCPLCKGQAQKEDWVYCPKCKPMPEQQPKKSWLGDMELPVTDLEVPMSGAEFMEYECPVCKETFEDYDLGQHDKTCPGTPEVMHDEPAISIKEDMPRASMTDHLAQSLQLEDQKISSQNDKIKTEAVNALVSMLQGMGHGSSKIAEVTESSTGYDVMATIDSNGALRAVSIPVTVKEGKVVLPKKALVSELVAKGIDLNARLSEEFGKTVLARIEAEEARVQYETEEANQIIAERVGVSKEATGSTNEQFLGETDLLEVQKHLLPDHEKMKLHDKISDGGDQWELVDMDSNQNDRNENSASIWKFKKCAPPAADKKEPETKIKA